MCPGNVQLEGYGQTSLVNTGWTPETTNGGLVDLLPGGVLQARMGGRAYFASGCTNGIYSNQQYLAVNLIGKTVRYTIDISGAGCGCNAAFYLVSMRQNDNRSDCLDYYCDANSVCGVACDEIDIQEANLFSWHSTLHRFDDKGGFGRGYGGGGQDWNGPRDWTQADYGPGGRCIDTSHPFQVMASFPVDEHGELASLDVKLHQEGGSCSLQLAIDSYTGLPRLSRALQAGMTPVVSYWSSDDMGWMDGRGPDEKGPCMVDCPKNCSEAVQFSDFRIEDMPRLDKTCPGSVSVDGYGAVSLVGARLNKPGQVAGRADVRGGVVVAEQRSRLYFGEHCGVGDYINSEYTALKLLGRSFRYKVDLSAAGCGCNAAFYLTNLRQNFDSSQCSDYYCDANQVCGVRCAEIDLQEANRHAFYSTLHAPEDNNGLGAGYGNFHREWNSSVYGPNARCIDTLNPFEVNASFPVDGSTGLLAGMEITLTQVGKDCPLALKISSYLSGGSDGLALLTEALQKGMTPIMSYWGQGENMQWLDGPGSDGKGPCPSDGGSACTASKVYFFDFAVEDLQVATMTEGGRPATTPLVIDLLAGPPRTPDRTSTTSTLISASSISSPQVLPLPPLQPPAQPPAQPRTTTSTLRQTQTYTTNTYTVPQTQTYTTTTPPTTAVTATVTVTTLATTVLTTSTPSSSSTITTSYTTQPPPTSTITSALPHLATRAPTASGSPTSDHIASRYRFAGFLGPSDARTVCNRPGERLAMPKTEGERHALLQAVRMMIEHGSMSRMWPRDTLWLGGHWKDGVWQWDDGTPAGMLQWAEDQPSSKFNQKLEPWLCMVSDGHVYDSDAPYEFGAMCERAPGPEVPDFTLYEFLGYARGPDEARRACGQKRHLAMPKTAAAKNALMGSIRKAMSDGRMSRNWPNDTIWLGGRWTRFAHWEWDDGTPAQELSWATGQPSGQGSQEREPWLCMLSNGKVHDSSAGTPPYAFGVMCEKKQTTERASESASSGSSNRISFCCADANDPNDVCGTCTSSSGPCGGSRSACEACPGLLKWCSVEGDVADAAVADAGLVISRLNSDGRSAGLRQTLSLRRLGGSLVQVVALALAAVIILSTVHWLWKRQRAMRRRRLDWMVLE